MQEQRRLAAIMFTDMVGFSALTHRNEALALEVLNEHWRLLRSVFPRHNGREIRSMGDGVFVEFASALEAARCAIELQQTLRDYNTSAEPDRHILIRIGLHLGDVVETSGNVHGDGVNIAARIEPLASAGGICVSEDVARQIQNKVDLPLQKLGLGELKNISLPVTIYKILLPWEKRLRIDQLYFRFRRRKVQVWALLTGIASLVVAVYVLPRFFTRPPEPPPVQRLGILRFQSLTPEGTSTSLGVTLQTLFAEQFIGIEGLGVVDPISLNNLIDSSHPHQDVDVLKAISTAQLSMVLDGSINANPSGGYSIQAKLLDPTSGTVTLTQSATFMKEADLPGAVSSLSSRILSFLQLRILNRDKDADLRPWIAHKSQNIEAVKAFIQASQFIYRGEPGEEKYLRRAIELDSLFIPARIWLISGMIRRGQVQEAKDQHAFLQTLETTAGPFDATMIEWAGAYINGDVPSQARALARALELSPGNNILLYALGRARFIMGDYRGAIEPVTDAIGMKWPFSPAYYLAAESHFRLGEYEQTKKILESSLGIQPVYRDVYGLLSLMLLRDSDTTGAARYEDLFIRRSLELGDSEDAADAALADVSSSHGFFPNAVRLYRKAISLDASTALYHVNLGGALVETGDFAGAKDECTRALRLDPVQHKAEFFLGRAIEGTGDSTGAVQQYQKFLQHDSTSDESRLARVRVGFLHTH